LDGRNESEWVANYFRNTRQIILGIGGRFALEYAHDLAKAAGEHLAMLKATPSRIRKYFDDPAIAYASI
jgi:hypothetical protein